MVIKPTDAYERLMLCYIILYTFYTSYMLRPQFLSVIHM